MTTLRSRAYARILDLVSEGEIEGLVDGAKSIYLNGTPLQNADGSFNFENVTFDTRTGTNGQAYISGTPGVESETNVSVEIKNSAAVTRTISNSDVDAVRVTISLPSLFRQKDDGGTAGRAVEIAIDVQTAGGGFVTRLTDTIDGKSTSKYQRAYRVALSGAGPWDIRVRRITGDTTDLKIQDKTFWDSFTEIIDAKLRYPNSALVSMRFDAASFSGVPTRAFELKLKRVQVPSNYNAATRTYTGAWNGTFQTAWTDNPAWCFYDLVTNTRYGLGEFIDPAQVDKWALYAISQYCDELVDDGLGGTEPRFTCNLYLQSRTEAYKVVQDLASCFRSMVYWASGSLTLAQDAPSDPVALFSQANVVDGAFSYSGSSAKARHTVAMVTWNDPADLYAQKIEYVEDQDAIARFGVVPTEVVAIGCTSRGQAARVGRWLLYSERHESETVTFQTGVEGAVARPGQVIKVADASRAGVRLGGRVRSATTSAITMDAAVNLGGASWTLYAMLPDGTVGESQVASANGNTVNLVTPLADAPQAGAQWVMSATTTEAQTFRVLTVVEQDSGIIEITGLKHDADKYDAVENGLVLQSRTITQLSPVPDTPTDLVVTESLYTYQAEVRAQLNIGWANVQGASTYRVLWSKDGANFSEAITSISDYDVLDITPGDFVVRVYAIGPTGKESAGYAEASFTALGKTAPPANVTGLQAIIDPNIGITLTWNKVADLDLDGYEIKDGSTVLGLAKTTSFKVGLLPVGAKTYTVRALDTSGNFSTTPASVSVIIVAAAAPTVAGSFAGENLVLTWNAVQGDLATQAYEIRYGASYAAGTSLGTIKGTSFSTKAAWVGARTFWVAAIDLSNNTGTPGSFAATVNAPTAVSMTQEVIDNNVLLKWSDGTATLPIDYYELRKGASFAGATVIGRISARFATIFESTAGVYKYWIAGVDVAGNMGATANVDALVNQPPDYQLEFNRDTDFSGTRDGFVVFEQGYLTPINTTETWQQHFTSRGWNTLQDQVNAGFPLYGMPSASAGSYEETIDYGTVLAATKISATLSFTSTAGTVTVTPKISVRKLVTDPWIDYPGLASVFVTDFRYAKVRFDFASVGGDDLVTVTGLNIRFDVKLKNDAGTATVNAADSGGTAVSFNVSFVDVESITVTPKGTAARIAVYDFVDAPNPTSFKVLLFDTAGTRVSGDVSWSVKGI